MRKLIKLARRGLIPPQLYHSLEKRFNIGASKAPSHPVPEDIETLHAALYGRGSVPFSVNIDELRYGGGMAFSYEQHHFVRYLASGQFALQDYYLRHQPKDIFAQHFLESQGLGPCPMNYPWFSWKRVYKGEAGLGASHGRQQYGPVSADKVALEAARLDSLLQSIHKNGYTPLMSGHTREYLLQDRSREDGYRFVVCGGQHRAAVLAHMGYVTVPVIFQPDWPRIIRLEDVSEWPLVRSGLFTEEEAVRIFSAYFRSPSALLLT